MITIEIREHENDRYPAITIELLKDLSYFYKGNLYTYDEFCFGNWWMNRDDVANVLKNAKYYNFSIRKIFSKTSRRSRYLCMQNGK